MNMMGRITEPQAAEWTAPPPAPALGWRAALVVLGLGLLAWALLFSEEIVAAVGVWNASTAYNHGWLILPLAAWLFWQRRHRLEGLAPTPLPLAALLAIPGTLAWLAAERLGIMEVRQFAAFGLAQVLVLAVLGWPFVRAFIGPLGYLVFLVPFGGFAVVPLQYITAWFIETGLILLGITHYRDGLIIETTAGMFHVAEACAGLRFIIAALAFGALYALVIFRSFWRRALVMALALVVPVIANGIRALGIVVAAEYLGSAEAAAADHIIYGWGFFSAVILLLVLAGLPFREDAAPPAARPPSRPARPARLGPLAAAGALAVALIATGPAGSAGLAYNAGAPVALIPRLAVPAGCVAAADGATLSCEGMAVSVSLQRFSPRASWREVSAARWQAMTGSDTDLTFGVPIQGGGAWAARQPGNRPGAMAIAAWLDGRAVGHGLATRLAQARNSLVGGGGAPVLAVVTLAPLPGSDQPPSAARSRALLETVLAAQGDALVAQAAAASRAR